MNRIQEKMASRHVQRILSPRSKTNNLNAERETFEKTQSISICKAVSETENSVKEKHVRRIIIGTFQEKSGYTFWRIIRTRAPVQDNAICAWKFCHVTHKILREGYRKVIVDSYNHRQYILDTGKMFGLLREGYGKLIQHYCTLLVNKIDFHIRNPRFPGNLQVTDEELENIGENDVNVFFQLSCEMFDYLDEILALQAAIFEDPSRASSMTNHGQCKLAPLILLIQDSSQLYDYSVKVLFRLHNVLPSGTLDGHRIRFLNQFKILKQFYINSSNLQYFRNLIQIPLLPDKPPNFLLASDISMHVTPVVIVPTQRESPDGIENVGNLVDLSFADEADEDELALVRRENNDDDEFDFHFSSNFDQISSSNYETSVKAIENGPNDLLVENLKQKITELEMNTVELDRKIVQLTLENENAIKEREELKAELSRANVGTDVLIEKERALEKFNKVKAFYDSLREEHICLLRKKAEVDKELIKIKSAYEKLEHETSNLERNIESDHKLKEEIDQVTSKYNSTKEFNSKLLSEISTIKQEKDRALNRLDEVELNLSNYREKQERRIDQFKQKFTIELLNLLIEQLKNHLVLILEEGEFEDYNQTNISSSPEYFFKRFNDLSNLVEKCTNEFKELNTLIHQTNADEDQLISTGLQCTKHCIDFNYNLVYLYFMSKILQHSITNLNTGEELNSNFKSFISTFTNYYDRIIETNKNKNEFRSLDTVSEQLIEQINRMINMKNKIMPHLSSVELKNLQELLEQEINEMDRAIQEAVSKIDTMLETSKKQDKDIKLEVNGSILESSSSLMKAVMQLVQNSRELQQEIVMENKGSNVKEFYQKNHRWTEGLITASKVVAYSAKYLVDSADQVVSGKAEFATIIVASQEIAASTAQLVAASRVKANSIKSAKLNALLKSSKNVTMSTSDVISTTKNCINLLNHEQDEARLEEELQKLTIHNAKKIEMEVRLNIIRMEDALIKERLKLAQLRKIHYHLTE